MLPSACHSVRLRTVQLTIYCTAENQSESSNFVCLDICVFILLITCTLGVAHWTLGPEVLVRFGKFLSLYHTPLYSVLVRFGIFLSLYHTPPYCVLVRSDIFLSLYHTPPYCVLVRSGIFSFLISYTSLLCVG